MPSATIITTVDVPVHLLRNVAGNAHPLIRWTTNLIIRAQIRPCAFWMSIFEPRNFQPTVMVRPSPGRAEHLTSLHIASRIPACNICSKCHGVQEHIYHVSDFTDVPTRNILVEGFGVCEHDPHARHRAYIPSSNILIEGVGTIKHATHISHFAHVPFADIGIKPMFGLKKRAHVYHIANFPARHFIETCRTAIRSRAARYTGWIVGQAVFNSSPKLVYIGKGARNRFDYQEQA